MRKKIYTKHLEPKKRFNKSSKNLNLKKAIRKGHLCSHCKNFSNEHCLKGNKHTFNHSHWCRHYTALSTHSGSREDIIPTREQLGEYMARFESRVIPDRQVQGQPEEACQREQGERFPQKAS